MTETNKETLTTIFTNVLEQMAFMFADPATQGDLFCPPTPVRTTMGFRGPKNGAVLLAVPQSICADLAANVLGIEPEDASEPKVGQDALSELLNVITGHILTTIYGEEPVFDLSIPEYSALDEDTWKALAESPDTVGFLVEDDPVLLSFREEG